MSDVTNDVDSSKVHKTRTSITLAPEMLKFVKVHAEENKTSVSQVLEDLIVELKNKVESV